MKKSILTIAAIASAACALAACNSSRGNSQSDEYQKLNDMLNASYSKIAITVTDTFIEEGVTLKSEYTLNYSESEITVNYKVERFAQISLDSPATDVKTTYTGTATIKDGKVTGGEEVGLSADIAETGLTFKKEYFENATVTGVFMQAEVSDTSAFLGSEVESNDMTVYAEFLNVFFNIEINYTQNKNKVKYEYVFTI